MRAGEARGPRPPWLVDDDPPGRLVTGAQLRVATGLVALAAVTVAVGAGGGPGGRFSPLTVLAGLAVVVGTAVGPTTGIPTVGVLLVAAVVVDRGPALVVVVAVAGLLHGMHLLASWSAAVPPRARLPVVALRPTARRWLLAQVLAAPVAVGVALAPAVADGARSLAVPAAVAVVAVALLVVRSVRRGT